MNAVPRQKATSPGHLRAVEVAGLIVCLMFAGCASADRGVTLPPLPAWPVLPDGAAHPVQTVHALDVGLDLLRRYPQARQAGFADRSYTRVPHAWLVAYLDWTARAAAAAGVRYTPESFDCDDFSVGFSFFAGLAASRAGVAAAPLLARIVVEQRPGLHHELVAVATDRGEFVVEPQPAAALRLVPLAQYDRPILAFTFGDATP